MVLNLSHQFPASFPNLNSCVQSQSFIFLLVYEIFETFENSLVVVQGWAGNIRCGITFHNPTRIKIPQYLLPDLMKLGQSYIYAIKPCLADPFNDLNEECMMTETIERYQCFSCALNVYP